MNQSLLTRLFKSLDGDVNSPMMKIAYSIIEDEKKKGHAKLAEKLQNIINENISKSQQSNKSLKLIKERNFSIPVDRRYKLPLANFIEREHLRHEMVLDNQVEHKLLRIEKEYLARERLAHFGLKPRRKILLYGSSGCGKSMAAERIAWDLGLPFYKVRFDTLISSYLGESASNLQNLFKSIQNYPCVLLLDEFDIIGKKRDLSLNDVGEMHRMVNILLGLLEEYDGEGILISTTNLEGSLDKALHRRFDDFIEFTKPGQEEIYELLVSCFSALKLNKEINLKYFSEKMLGLSYAIVVKIAADAAKKAIINSHEYINSEDINIALAENLPINQ